MGHTSRHSRRWMMGLLVVLFLLAPGRLSGLRDRIEHGLAPPPASDACPAVTAGAPGTVRTPEGTLRGARAVETYVFKGVPFAEPPVGELRWRPPVEVACWRGDGPADTFAPICPQFDAERVAQGDEDCLYLNIWTPATPPPASSGYPVMVFIHGGGNAQGSAAQPLYDGRALAERGAVLVTLQYRLGPFGFLVHPALSAERAEGISGNYGILDQIAALRWVGRNIAAVGGDPARVTIFGESAGGVNVCTLLASPLAAGLFQRAIIQSGGCFQPDITAAARTGERFVQAAGCGGAADVPACLRALDMRAVLGALPPTVSVLTARDNPYAPVVDGHVLLASPIEVMRAGRHNRVPIIIGANADETGQAAPRIATEGEYQRALEAIFPPALATVVMHAYPTGDSITPRAAFVAATSDARFICPSRRMTRAAAAGQEEPVYRYLFTQALRGSAAALGAFHGLELAFVFGTLGVSSGYTPSAEERAVMDAMMGYWTRFAATGDPNGSGAPAWPRYEAATDASLRLGTPITAEQGLRAAQCDFWDRIAGG